MSLLVSDVISLTNAKVFAGAELVADAKILKSACGADLMSDVLAFVKDQGMLITGLVNPQVVRTANMMDMKCILFVRGKEPDDVIISLANSLGIILLSTRLTMFAACGTLFKAGITAGTHYGE